MNMSVLKENNMLILGLRLCNKHDEIIINDDLIITLQRIEYSRVGRPLVKIGVQGDFDKYKIYRRKIYNAINKLT